MSAPEESNIKTQFATISKGAHLNVLLPRTPDLDVSGIYRDGSPEDLTRLPSRRNLFFDEKAPLIVILRTSASEEDIRTLLPSLEIVLAPHATDAVPQGSGNAASASGKHDLTSKTISASDVTDIVSAGKHTYVIWKPVLQLSRPRAKLQRPAIYFTAHLTISNDALNTLRQRSREYLKSFEPLPGNVLEPLRFDPAFGDSNIYLSETRITKVAPATGKADSDVKPIRGASKRAFPVVPALFTKIRYSALPDAVVASLHIEVSQLVTGSIKVKRASVEVPNAETEILCPLDGPREMRASDEVVLLYKLTRPIDKATANSSSAAVNIQATVSLDQDSHVELDISWQAKVDLSQTAVKPIYKWSRPLSGTSQQRASLQDAERPTSVGGGSLIAEIGITFNFTAPLSARRNDEFRLEVQCINRSSRPRRFALVLLQPKRATMAAKRDSSSLTENTSLIASIFNAPPLEQQHTPDVLDLNPDVRIGPLRPGDCFETQMKFRALRTGVLDLGVVRIVDLDTRQTVDVRELPDVVAIDGERGEQQAR
ncbi:hypothetical protein LTR37_000566 [Vermiconidia calcicola]|uniref:Uncharacterized protein n=1 Tax=Vermiconidia calcicola TaxID=1690605 RepID=A0ACC3NXY6_9PEZI|nr:hypothetical protein LTR37_000566 [Vermiconidia calcicola]